MLKSSAVLERIRFLGERGSFGGYGPERTTVPAPVKHDYSSREEEHRTDQDEHGAPTDQPESGKGSTIECEKGNGYDG